MLVIVTTGYEGKGHSQNLSLFENILFTPFLSCRQCPQVSEFLEDQNHVYFVILPCILAQCVPGALCANGIKNITDIYLQGVS